MSKTTKALAAHLSRLLGLDVEVIDMDDVTDASPEGQKFAAEQRELRDKAEKDMQVRRDQVSLLVDELVRTLQVECCDRNEHRRVPKDADDRLAIANAMGFMMVHHGEVVTEYIGRMRGMLDKYLTSAGQKMHPDNEQELKELDLEMAATHSILAAHFDLLTNPQKPNYLTHYAKISAMVKAWSQGKETGSEARTTH